MVVISGCEVIVYFGGIHLLLLLLMRFKILLILCCDVEFSICF